MTKLVRCLNLESIQGRGRAGRLLRRVKYPPYRLISVRRPPLEWGSLGGSGGRRLPPSTIKICPLFISCLNWYMGFLDNIQHRPIKYFVWCGSLHRIHIVEYSLLRSTNTEALWYKLEWRIGCASRRGKK